MKGKIVRVCSDRTYGGVVTVCRLFYGTVIPSAENYSTAMTVFMQSATVVATGHPQSWFSHNLRSVGLDRGYPLRRAYVLGGCEDDSRDGTNSLVINCNTAEHDKLLPWTFHGYAECVGSGGVVGKDGRSKRQPGLAQSGGPGVRGE